MLGNTRTRSTANVGITKTVNNATPQCGSNLYLNSQVTQDGSYNRIG
jgi:hypothetical protein